ncbi:MAG: hypothetical protein K6B40_05395 [Firmicutes bacterium]|nr:hypothetical protein [Bacillota bacterium]
MFQCEDCGRVFRRLKRYRENRGPTGENPLPEIYWACPFCGGAWFKVADCPVCGERWPEEQLTEGICPDCGGMILRQLAELADKEFSREERRYIREMIQI